MKKFLLVSLGLFILIVGGAGLFYYIQRDVAHQYEADISEIIDVFNDIDYDREEIDDLLGDLKPPFGGKVHKEALVDYMTLWMDYEEGIDEYLAQSDTVLEESGFEGEDEVDFESMSTEEINAFLDSAEQDFADFEEDYAEFTLDSSELMVELENMLEDSADKGGNMLESGLLISLLYGIDEISVVFDTE